jgi:FtsP/CotA-like multicopper oxidase with cupredoxin domain
MADMGMADMAGMSGMSGMEMQHGSSGMSNMPGMDHGNAGMGAMKGMDMPGMNMAGMDRGMSSAIPTANATGIDPKTLTGQPQVDNVAMMPMDRLGEAGTGLDGNGRRVLRYSQLKAAEREEYPLEATRAIEFHLTGNMERWVWGFDGKKFSEAPPVPVKLGETVRFILINDTMMEHPIHLHGFLFRVENGQGDRDPLKHTINVKPGGKVSFVYTADTPGRWAFHCHLLYHMEMGMFRTVVVA